MTAQIAQFIRARAWQINANQQFFKGSQFTLLYLTGSFLMGYIEVRHSLLYYGLLVTRYIILLLLWQLSNITKYTIKTGNQVTLLTNVMRYLNNIVTVTSLILCNIIPTSNEVTNLVSYPLNNA